MSDLRLELGEDSKLDAGPGRYADKKALVISQRYLEGQILARDAAKEMTDMLPGLRDRKDRGVEAELFGFLICQMARQIPYSHHKQSRLVQLVRSISRSPKMAGQTHDGDYLIGCSMDNFNGQLREQFRADFSEDDPDGPMQYSLHLNSSGFLARLTQCGFIDDAMFFVWAMRESLEETITHRESRESLVSSAAVWVLLAGQALYTLVVEAPIPDENKALYRTGQLCDGPQFGLERWRFWKESFVTVVATKETGEECRRLAERAAEMMDVIERAMGF